MSLNLRLYNINSDHFNPLIPSHFPISFLYLFPLPPPLSPLPSSSSFYSSSSSSLPSSSPSSHISSSSSPLPDRPTTTVTYQQLSVTSSTPYRLNLTHGDEGPTFACMSSGYFPPTLTWQKDNGGSPLPNQVNSVIDSSDVQPIHELRWSRSLRYTDSGTYSCTAENDNGTDTATLDLLVQCELVLWAGLRGGTESAFV